MFSAAARAGAMGEGRVRAREAAGGARVLEEIEERKPSVLSIRLARIGARKQPHYRIVVIDKQRARGGRPVEVVGNYNPRTSPATVNLKRERIAYWVSKGAQLSGAVSRLLEKTRPAGAHNAA